MLRLVFTDREAALWDPGAGREGLLLFCGPEPHLKWAAYAKAFLDVAERCGVRRIVSLGSYVHDPHLIKVGLAELLILLAAVALVAPDAARAQTAAPAPPLYPHPG